MREIIPFLRELIALAKERNVLGYKTLEAITQQAVAIQQLSTTTQQQTALLTEIVAELKPLPPSPPSVLVLTLGKQVLQ